MGNGIFLILLLSLPIAAIVTLVILASKSGKEEAQPKVQQHNEPQKETPKCVRTKRKNWSNEDILKVVIYVAAILLILIVSAATPLGPVFFSTAILGLLFFVLRLIEYGIRIIKNKVRWKRIKKLNLRKICRERGRDGMREVLKKEIERREIASERVVIIIVATLISIVIIFGIIAS